MHILVTNDDGPPSQQSSPYVHAFVKTLQGAGHTVSVILPHQQRSWIGKAHFVGQVTKPTYFRPGTVHQDDGTIHGRPGPSNGNNEEWVLVDGTPASCAQLGLYHFFQDRGPVDLVVSGPNYGRNSTSLFSLSSGTIGGAMEAAVCGKRAIALSFAFYSRDHDPNLIAGASRHAVQVIEHLHKNWSQDVDLYSINVPLVAEVESHKTLFTHALQNYWTSGSSFEEVPADEEDQDPTSREQEIRESEVSSGAQDSMSTKGHKHRHFKWAPKFGDVQKSIDASPPGNDGWAISQGYTSVTPFKANFMHSTDVTLGELKLSNPCDPTEPKAPAFYALIRYEDDYVQPLILSTLESQLAPSTWQPISTICSLPYPSAPVLQITSYETLDFTHLLANPTTSLANAYIIRKALIRKHYLAHTVSSWLSKHPSSPFKDHVKPTLDIELDYAEFLDDALLEAYELHESFAHNAALPPENREWWILKPSMSDRGHGIRLFSSEDELRSIFDGWEAEAPGSEDENTPNDKPSATIENDGIVTSQLRHFVVQPYIHPPLLLPSLQSRKFHLRSYVLAIGSLRVYIYKELLALFAPEPYLPPSSSLDPRIHLTNTCLHSSSPPPSPLSSFPPMTSSPPPTNTRSIHTLSSLPLPPSLHTSLLTQISTTTASLFEAAARGQMIHFQTLPNAFEIFGVDWMVDEGGRAWLLEVNAFPDFARSGVEGREVVRGVWEGVVGMVGGFFGVGVEGGEEGVREEGRGEGKGDEEGGREGEARWGMRKVLDIDLGRR